MFDEPGTDVGSHDRLDRHFGYHFDNHLGDGEVEWDAPCSVWGMLDTPDPLLD